MNIWLNLILSILACYRLSQLFATDEGPFEIFLRLRAKLGAYDYDETGKAKTSLGRAMACPYCLGMWIALPVVLCATGMQWYTLLWWLAVAGGQAFLQEIVDGHQKSI